MTSVDERGEPGEEQSTQGCSGGGSAPEPDPDRSLATDLQRDTIPPSDCNSPSNTHWQQLYCRSVAPDSAQKRKTLQALNRIAQRGHECAVLAQKGREMVEAGEIRFFVWQPGDAAGYGHPNTDIQIDRDMVNFYDPVANPFGSYEHTLVHELDHMFRRDHIDSTGEHTPHTAVCGREP